MSSFDTLLRLVRVEEEWRREEWRRRGLNPDLINVKPQVHKKHDGLLLIHPNGRCEYLTFFGAIRHRLTGWLPPLDYRFFSDVSVEIKDHPHAE